MRIVSGILASVTLLGALMAPRPLMAAGYPTYHVNELFLTPYSARLSDNLGAYNTPDSGKHYLVVMFHVANRDDVENEASGSDFKVIAAGQSISTDYTDPPKKLASVVLEPGTRIDGGLVFQVPNGVHSGALIWAPNAPCCGDIKYPTYRWKLHF